MYQTIVGTSLIIAVTGVLLLFASESGHNNTSHITRM